MSIGFKGIFSISILYVVIIFLMVLHLDTKLLPSFAS